MRYILFTFFLITALGGYGQELPAILENSQDYDGQSVTVTGEVIGEVLSAPDGLWLNILGDEGVNIGVFCERKSQVQGITRYGSYAYRGDRIRIEGVFYANCPQHSERDIHARSISVVAEGHPRAERATAQKKSMAIVLAGACGMLALIYSVKRRYGRKNPND